MTVPSKILKFGGSSLSSSEGLKNAYEIVASAIKNGEEIAIVASAFSGCTSLLLEICEDAAQGGDSYSAKLDSFAQLHGDLARSNIDGERQPLLLKHLESRFAELRDVLHGVSLVKDISPKTRDLVSGYGELLAAFVVSEYLRQKLPTVTFLDARQLILTDSNFGGAVVQQEETKRQIIEHFTQHNGVPVITGFIGANEQGETTTLGRGGSDYTAAIFATALSVEEIQLWTNVDGVMTADPRKVRKALTIPSLSYKEAMELTHFGAEVMYPPAIQPAFHAGIPIRVRNTFKPDFRGTVIKRGAEASDQAVTGITSIGEIELCCLEGSGMVGVAGISKRLFDALSRESISVILISQASSEHSICFAVPQETFEAAKAAVDKEFRLEIDAKQVEPLSGKDDHVIVAVVGANMANTPGIAGRVFQALGRNGINIAALAQGSSELNISMVVRTADESKALNALHDTFFLSERKTLNLFFIGVGNVGSKLLEQIGGHAGQLYEQNLEINIVALANSRGMRFSETGLEADEWQNLEEEVEKFELDAFVSRMRSLNLPNSVFVDCTASDEVASKYEEILAASISVATPNKKANSGSFEHYLALKKAEEKGNSKYFYETTVGAGLPVIGTLGDLITSGDKILRIEAVLSGTLSFIFNSFGGDSSFSEVVRDAKEKGYTEPDPREDLSGTDVARKLLVLAREMGMPMELADVSVESLIPENCADAKDVEEFFTLLKDSDGVFGERLEKAKTAGQVLRYIGSIENGEASVSLQAVGADHPFFALTGSDNIISFVTQRYFECPLVVKGPGAGTDVTAAGVFADIVRIATYQM